MAIPSNPEPMTWDEMNPPTMRGMYLRDWFAGMALMGATASPELMRVVTSGEIKDGSMFERMAVSMYQQADAMLKARSKS